jgi:hypothetical protein
MVPEGEDVQEEIVRIQGEDHKFNTEKPYIDFAKAIKRVCPPNSTICVQHAGAYVKGYSKGHGFFLYTNQNGQTVYGHGNADDGIMRHDNSQVGAWPIDIPEAQSIKNQTANLLSGKRKAEYTLTAGSKDQIHPDVELTDEEFDTALNHPNYGIKMAAIRSKYFGPQHVDIALGDDNYGVRLAAVRSPAFGPQHVDRALEDEDPGVKREAVLSPAFGPQHVEKALGDRGDFKLRKMAVLSPAFGPQHVDIALGDDNYGIRVLAVESPAFGPQHMDRALGDEHYFVRLAAVQSPHFGPQHMDRALEDTGVTGVSWAAERRAAEFAKNKSN